MVRVLDIIHLSGINHSRNMQDCNQWQHELRLSHGTMNKFDCWNLPKEHPQLSWSKRHLELPYIHRVQ